MTLLSQRQELNKALQDPNLTEEEKRKIKLAIEVREFSEKELGLNVSQIYTSYVKLNRPYVTWVVSAAPKWKLESYTWDFPLVGKMPYKGFFSESEALEEEADLKKNDLDTYVRGVSAYSTLGWFKDPILSSMTRYKDFDFVDTLIHESVHTTLYIKNEADFNERLAVFLGHKGMELFYLKKEGPNSEKIQESRKAHEDDQVFSKFISAEVEHLNDWYLNLRPEDKTADSKQLRIEQIQSKFKNEILPLMKTENWKHFEKTKLNNARLTLYKTYMKNLDEFELAYQKTGSDFKKFMSLCKTLEKEKDPAKSLAEFSK